MLKRISLFVLTAVLLAFGGVAVAGHGWHPEADPVAATADPSTPTALPATSISSPTPLPTVSPTPIPQSISDILPSASPTAEPSPSSAPLPETLSLTVPFLVQAPMASWDALHEDACEEASVLMVQHYLQKTVVKSPAAGDTEITNLVAYEEAHGYAKDLTVEQLRDLATEYFPLKTGRVVLNPTVAEIKAELASGHPVIIPAAGRELGNPHYTGAGPIYHMLVVTGYTADSFITNDPGTRYGKGYAYPYETLLKATHSWNTTNIDAGKKAYLVFE